MPTLIGEEINSNKSCIEMAAELFSLFFDRFD